MPLTYYICHVNSRCFRQNNYERCSFPDNVFDFNTSHRKHPTSEEGHGTELLPILHTNCESDGETPLHSPNSVANPTYHQLPSLKEVAQDNSIVHTADNYVNMPQNKNICKEKSNAASSEPHHYVNTVSGQWDPVTV